MRKIVTFIIILLLTVAGGIWIFRTPKDNWYNIEVCNVVNISIKGKITGYGGHGIYQWIEINNLKKSISVAFSKVIYQNGYTDSNVYYEIGDSIMKESGSKELTIKSKDRIGIYELDCN